MIEGFSLEPRHYSKSAKAQVTRNAWQLVRLVRQNIYGGRHGPCRRNGITSKSRDGAQIQLILVGP